MKTLITILFALFTVLSNAQEVLDTIYANDTKNVALFFEKPIRQAITGASHFVFTYNRASEQHFGLLQAQPGIESNLLVVTSDGQVYSYILKHQSNLSKLNYFIPKRQSIGNEKPKSIKFSPKKITVGNRANRITYFEKFSEYLLSSKLKKLVKKRDGGISLSLQKTVYDHSEVYLVLEIENTSGIDFEIDFLNIYTINGTKKKKASYQKLQHNVVYKHELPSVVKDKMSKQFVIVMPKFVLSRNEKLEIELKELNGNRKMLLKTNSLI